MNRYEEKVIRESIKWKEGILPISPDLFLAVIEYQEYQKQKLQDISFLEEERDRLLFEYLRMEGRIEQLKLKGKALSQEKVSRISKSIASKVKVCDCLVGNFGIDGKRSVCINCQGIRRKNYY